MVVARWEMCRRSLVTWLIIFLLQGRSVAAPSRTMSAWHFLSRKLVELEAAAMGRMASPSMLSKLVLRSPLTHLLGKRQRRLLPSFAACSQVSLMPAALPSRATALVLKYCPPEDLARLAVTNAAWACRLVEHAATEETWAAWAAMTPRPTLQHMQQLCAACTLRLPPSQTIEGLRAMEVSVTPDHHTTPTHHVATSPPAPTHPARRHRSAVGAERVRCQGSRARVHANVWPLSASDP